jgi:MoxR-like ATPase
MNEPALDVGQVADRYAALRESIGAVIVGQHEAVRLATITLLCSAHSLIEGVPGVAKTLLVHSLAAALEVRFGRVQFTPDLMPSDIVGTLILGRDGADARFRQGPIFTDLLLADEINRASAKTQAALLEAMQERTVTVDGTSHPLGDDFAVFATQNPVEQEGTYPLPEAELDRFLFKIVMSYPDTEEEVRILARHHAGADGHVAARPGGGPAGARIMGPGELATCRDVVARVIVRDEILAYTAALVRATRADVRFALGASPRAGVMLLRAAKATAVLEGRDFVLPEDVQSMVAPALRHRVQLDPAVEVEGLRADEALERVVRSVPVPR